MKRDTWKRLSMYSLKLAITSMILVVLLIVVHGAKAMCNLIRTDRHCYDCETTKKILYAVECSDGTFIYICADCATKLKNMKKK